jgi:hypothetical protein
MVALTNSAFQVRKNIYIKPNALAPLEPTTVCSRSVSMTIASLRRPRLVTLQRLFASRDRPLGFEVGQTVAFLKFFAFDLVSDVDNNKKIINDNRKNFFCSATTGDGPAYCLSETRKQRYLHTNVCIIHTYERMRYKRLLCPLYERNLCS